MYELKIYRGVMCHDNEEWSKNWRGIDLSVRNWREEFGEFWPEQSKIIKICTLIGYFLPKHTYKHVWGKKSADELCLMALKIGAKFEGKLACAF